MASVKQPLVLLNIHDLFQAYGGDLENITEEDQADMIMHVEKLRKLLRGDDEDNGPRS